MEGMTMPGRMEPEDSPYTPGELAYPGLTIIWRAKQLLEQDYEQTKDPIAAEAIANFEPILIRLGILRNRQRRS
jgi:hypothetical protein